MRIKSQLKLLNFLQYFIWGAWLVTIASYFFAKNWTPSQFGIIYSTIGLSAIGFPALFGFLTDKYFQLKKVYRALHFISALIMLLLPLVKTPIAFFWVMLLYMIFYMSTIPLLITYSYSKLKEDGFDVKLEYPKIRVWGTIGFVVALWIVSFTKSETTVNQFYISGIASLLLFLVTFFISKSIKEKQEEKVGFLKIIGLDALDLLTRKKLYPFFILSFFFGIALIVSNGYVDAFIHDLMNLNSGSEIIFKYPAIIVSVSQISEIIFILCIPFLLKRFSLKTIIIFGFSAWIVKFFALYLAVSSGIFVLLLISSACYGIAFDLFIIPGSLFLEENVEKERRGSVQGVFVMMVNGFGSLFGSFFSGFLIDAYFTNDTNDKNWASIWLFFTLLMLIIIFIYLFLQFFKTKQKPSLNIE